MDRARRVLEFLGAAVIGFLLLAFAYWAALELAPKAARAGDYGEYAGQRRWAEEAFSGGAGRIRGKPQYEPGGYYDGGYHRDNYSAGNHAVYPRNVAPHSHPHHRRHGYSKVTHTHPVVVYKTHTHVYRPRYTHPRYTYHYRRWRPHYHYDYRPWQEHAWRRYITVRVPIDRHGNIIPGHGYRLDDYRDPRDRERFSYAYQDERARWSELDRLARRGYMDQDRIPSKAIDCKPPVKVWGESRLTHANAQKQARIGWSAAVLMEYGAKYADLRYARRGKGWERCLRSEYNEEGVKKVIDAAASVVTGGQAETWKEKCVIVAVPCAPALKPSCLTKNCEKDNEPSLDDDEEDGEGPTHD